MDSYQPTDNKTETTTTVLIEHHTVIDGKLYFESIESASTYDGQIKKANKSHLREIGNQAIMTCTNMENGKVTSETKRTNHAIGGYSPNCREMSKEEEDAFEKKWNENWKAELVIVDDPESDEKKDPESNSSNDDLDPSLGLF